MSTHRRSRRRKLRRPPFENRWGTGVDGWRWYLELERLGADYVRVRLAQQEALSDVQAVEPLTPPLGFVRDWLSFRERHDRQVQRRWRVALLAVALVAAIAAIVAATPLRTWL